MSSTSSISFSLTSPSNINGTAALQLQLPSVLYADTAMPLHTVSNTLCESIVINKTLDAYESAVNAFLQFCSSHNLTGNTSEEIDYYLNRYMESLYQNNIPNGRQLSANTLYGLIRRYPQYKLSFPISRQSLKGFIKLIPSESHTPLTYYTCIAMAATMSKSGFIDRAIALLLMFHCYLRISEMNKLCISDIALPGQNRFGSSIILSELRIAKSKTGKNQSVSITDPHIHILLQYLINNRSSNERVFNFSKHSFTRSFHQSISVLGLPSNIFVPHSCRHGGATYDHINGKSIEQIMLRGRWKSNDSARTYIQSSRALMLTVIIPSNVHDMGQSFASDLSTHIINLFNLFTLSQV